MMYITTNLTTYSPKNKACAEMCDFINSFEYIIIADECSLDALIEEIRAKAAQINANNPRVRPMRIDVNENRVTAIIDSSCPRDHVFFLCYHKVRSTYQFSEVPQKKTS